MPTLVPSDILRRDDLPTASGDADQTPEELATVKLVEKLFTKAKESRAHFDSKWPEYYKFFRGHQWKEKRPSYRHSEVLNYVASEIYNVLTLLTDSRPKIDYLPEDPTDYEFADIISKVVTAKWDQNNWSYTLAECITDASVFGTGIACVPYKPELSEGLGDFAFETEDIFYAFPDPNTKSKINDEYCDHFITAVPTDVGKVKRKYPDKAELIKSDLSSVSQGLLGPETDEIMIKSPTDNRVLLDMSLPAKDAKSDQVFVITCYLRSEETIEEKLIEKDDETGLEVEKFQQKKKYPNGRKVVIANGVLLEDGPNPYVNSKFPYARLVDHIVPRQFWGRGEVEQLSSSQQIINKLISYILDYLILTGNPIWILDSNAVDDASKITNQPGLKVVKTPGSEVRREEGAQLPSYISGTLEYMIERVLPKLGSTTEISNGIAPNPNSSGYAIEQLQDAAQTKIRGKARNIEVFLREVGELFVDRILQFYNVPRIVRLTNNEGAEQYFKFSISDVQDESGQIRKKASIQEFKKDPLTNQYVASEMKDVLLKSRLDVKITVGSTLPFAKANKAMTAERLFDKQIIDAEELLTQLEYPNKEKIIERLKQRQMAAPMGQEPGGVPAPQPPPVGGPSAP